MKNFLDYLTEVDKTYEFRIKLANVDVSECADKLRNALNAFGLDKLSEAKRLPIQANDIDFPNMPNVEIHLMDAVLKYPVTDAQLRAIVSERVGIPANQIVVVNPSHPEEQWRWNEDGSSELHEYKQGEAVLDKPYEDNPEGKTAGEKYAKKETIFKELDRTKWVQAGNDTTVGGEADPAYGKTTNDLPAGDLSPVGSKQNDIPSPV